MTTAKIQHYVPQFLLRNFSNGKKDQVWVYDKSSNRSFPSHTKNIASENRFYDFEFAGQSQSIEPWLSALESDAKSVIDIIINSDSLATLTKQNRKILSDFLAIQFTRTKNFREEWSSFPQIIKAHLEKNGDQVSPGSQAEEFLREISENESKLQTSEIVLNAPANYGAIFLDKTWMLAAASANNPFLLGDSPIARQNLIQQPYRGNLGLGCPGIEIYLPISPIRALAIWCPTLTDLVHRSASLQKKENFGDPHGIIALSNSILSGSPVEYQAAHIENFNSLQIARSERYIFSALNDFKLAETMIKDHPNLKQGPRPTIAN